MAKDTVVKRDAKRGAVSPAILVAGGALVVALIGVVTALVILLNREPTVIREDDTPQQRTVVINEENVEEVAEELLEEEPVEMGFYEVSMNMAWHFPDGSSPSTDAYVENVASNTHAVYFDVARNDTQEVIYASPVLSLGSHIQNFALDTDLDAGTYDCVCTYHLVNDEQRTISTVNIAVTVIVES